MEHYSNALELQPGWATALNNRAMARLRAGDAAGASADCDAVLADDPRNVKALLRRAAAREELGRPQPALEDLRQVLQLQPQNKEAQQGVERLGGGGGAQSEAAPVEAEAVAANAS